VTRLDAAWLAFDARKQHGDDSEEYRLALAKLEYLSANATTMRARRELVKAERPETAP
jgi:hypothetical protein